MKNIFRRKTKDNVELERALKAALVPVRPDPAYVDRLAARLRAFPMAPTIAAPSAAPDRRMYALAGLAGAFSALMLIAAGFRTLAAILGAIGLLNEVGRQIKNKEAAPVLEQAP